MINIMIYDILDKIIQYFCKHDKKWQSEQEISRSKSWTKTFTCSYKYNIEYEVHCFRCWKKWNETKHK